MTLNRNYKDSVFRMLFNQRENALSLYNALTGQDYGDDATVKFTTLEEVVMARRKNDISFLLNDIYIILYEHQSTLTGNFPLRDLIYYTTTVQGFIKSSQLYQKKAIKLPRPIFIVLYNGLDETEDFFTMELSDAFAGEGKNYLQLTVQVYNIREGRNPEIMERCKALNEYSQFVERVREAIENAGGSLTDRQLAALVQSCIDEGILAEFLEEYGMEAMNILYTALTEEEIKEIAKGDGYTEGFDDGHSAGFGEGVHAVAAKLKSMGLDVDAIVNATGLTAEECEAL
jgi:hypothetical protein